MPALLFEDVFADARMEHGVDVDIHQVVKIAQIAAGYGIAGLVRKGEGINVLSKL